MTPLGTRPPPFNRTDADTSHTIHDVVASDDKDRPPTYHHIPTHARKPNVTADVDPLDGCC